jgi:hypothetical protein
MCSLKLVVMKNVLLTLLLAVSAPVVFAQGETALIDALKAKLQKVKDYQASGRMAIDVSFINAPPSAVQVYYKSPDKFKVVKEGGISILPKGGMSVNASALLLNSQYATVPAGTAVVSGVTTRVVKLLPLEEGSDVVLATLYIDEKALLVRKAAVTTRESGSYEIGMTYGRYASWGLPDKVLFSFNTSNYKLPKGVTFEYEKGTAKKPAPPKSGKGTIEITYRSYDINKGVDDKVF